jgi:hypothetical protein
MRGRRWARTVATVFFGISTVSLLWTLSKPEVVTVKGMGVVGWLIELAAVIALWQRQSSEYLRLAWRRGPDLWGHALSLRAHRPANFFDRHLSVRNFTL